MGDDSPYAARDAASAASEALGFTPSVKPMSQGDAPTGLTASRSAQVLIGKTVVGVVGEVNRELRKVVDVDDRVAFELRLGFLLASQKPAHRCNSPRLALSTGEPRIHLALPRSPGLRRCGQGNDPRRQAILPRG